MIAEVLLCSRTSVYRIVEAYLKETLDIFDAEGRISQPLRTTVLMPNIKQSIVALLKKATEVYGWCRTRWRCETLALELKAKSGIGILAETMRWRLKEIEWIWKWAKLVAKDVDSARITKLAHIRNHKRSFLTQVVADVLEHFQVYGPWKYQFSEIYVTPRN